MKTQITNLINGSKSVRIDENHAKYVNANRSTSHVGYAGTNFDERQEIAQKVIAENGDTLLISLFGKTFQLNKHSSLSGKTIYFSCNISLEDFMLISGYALQPFNKGEGEYTLMIEQDMKVQVSKSYRRNENAAWKYRGYNYIGEEFVTIL